jgi:hypothetical protein
MNNTEIHKQKYLKYKQKYLDLKYKQKYLDLKNMHNLKGGMGYYLKYWNQHTLFPTINTSNEQNLILNNDYNNIPQYTKYGNDLDKLLQMNTTSGIINIDFLTNFFRNIYYDTPTREYSKYAIRLSPDPNFPKDPTKKIARWVYPDQNKYNIVKTLIQPHGNTTIIFLQNKTDETDKKVLKTFNKVPCNFDSIKDYLPLEVIHITNNPTYFTQKDKWTQINYYPITPEKFEIINFNNQTNLIMNQNNEPILLAVPHNDAINDYINNIIIQKINNSFDEDNKINYVKYDNLFATQIVVDDGSWFSYLGLGSMVSEKNKESINVQYCIIMDQLDGSINNYFEMIQGETLEERQTKIHDILRKTETMLNKLKTPEYLFTHTDMKSENLFYKMVDGIPKLYLADFDKASISYHNVRFYNNIILGPRYQSYASKLTTSFVNKYSFVNKLINYDQYVQRELPIRKIKYIENTTPDNPNYNEPYLFRLSRVGREKSNYIGAEIEFEEFYLRYGFTPYYMNFDMITLILSIINKKIIGGRPPIKDTPLYNIITSYIIDTIYGIHFLFNLFEIFYSRVPINDGDFGELIILLIRQEPQLNMFKQKMRINNYLYIPRLFITERNKVALSIPFHHQLFIETRGDAETSVIRLNNNEQILYTEAEKQNEQSLIHKLIKFSQDPSDIELKNFVLEYTSDYHAFGGAWMTPSYNIIKTNRYSYAKPVGALILFSGIFDFDNFNDAQKEVIITIFNENNRYQNTPQ